MRHLFHLLTSFIAIVFIASLNLANAQENNKFGIGLKGIYINSSEVYFFKEKAIDKNGHFKEYKKNYLADGLKPLEHFIIEKQIQDEVFIILSDSGRYVMSFGLDPKFNFRKNMSFSYMSDLDIQNLNSRDVGTCYLDINAKEYTYQGLKLDEAEATSESNKIYSLLFKDENGQIMQIKVKPSLVLGDPQRHWSMSGQDRFTMRFRYLTSRGFCGPDGKDVRNLNEILVRKDDVLKEAESFQPMNDITSLIEKYTGKEVFLSKDFSNDYVRINDETVRFRYIPKSENSTNSDRYYFKKYTVCKVKKIHPEFYVRDGIHNATNLVQRYYATLSIEDSSCTIDIDYPLVDFDNAVLNEKEIAVYKQELERQRLEEERLAKEKEEQRIENEKRAEERRIELEKEEAKYKADLVRKYGKSNAELILNGKVKIGFTKEMCMEALGQPDSINTLSTKYDTQQWVYGFSLLLYFKGNILDDIQTFN